MVIDARQKFEERRWKNQLEEVVDEFMKDELDLDSFIEEMYYLGFDNILTRKAFPNK